MIVVPEAEFEQLVADALDRIPEPLWALVENVVVVVEDRHPTEELLGLYDGTPLTERADYGWMELPDRISIYRLPICSLCSTHDEVVEEVLVTVVHEIAHHFGIDDDELEALGWE